MPATQAARDHAAAIQAALGILERHAYWIDRTWGRSMTDIRRHTDALVAMAGCDGLARPPGGETMSDDMFRDWLVNRISTLDHRATGDNGTLGDRISAKEAMTILNRYDADFHQRGVVDHSPRHHHVSVEKAGHRCLS